MRDIERLIDWDGRLERKRNGELSRFLEHENPEVRAYAEMVAEQDGVIRAEIRRAYEEDEDALKAMFDAVHDEGETALTALSADREKPYDEDGDLPF